MSLTLELKPELEMRARARAAACGLPLDEYLRTLLEQALIVSPHQAAPIPFGEFDAIMDELAEGSDNLPALPILTREEIYADHD